MLTHHMRRGRGSPGLHEEVHEGRLVGGYARDAAACKPAREHRRLALLEMRLARRNDQSRPEVWAAVADAGGDAQRVERARHHLVTHDLYEGSRDAEVRYPRAAVGALDVHHAVRVDVRVLLDVELGRRRFADAHPERAAPFAESVERHDVVRRVRLQRGSDQDGSAGNGRKLALARRRDEHTYLVVTRGGVEQEVVLQTGCELVPNAVARRGRAA